MRERERGREGIFLQVFLTYIFTYLSQSCSTGEDLCVCINTNTETPQLCYENRYLTINLPLSPS